MQETQEILKQIKKLEISTKYLVNALITGNYHSVFKGQGIEFSELREYRSGDDIRSIDWNVTARYNQPYVKEFVEERDLHVYFILDMSGSGNFGNKIPKKRKALEIVASLMFAALRNNDNTGIFLFTDKIEKFIPARKGRKHVFQILSSIISFKPKSNTTNLKTTLIQVSQILKKRCILFIISDFFDSNDYIKPLKLLRGRHDVIILKISDLREQEIPEIGLIELEDEETGEQILVNTSDPIFQKKYAEIVLNNESQMISTLTKLKIDFIKILSDENYEIPLRKFFKKRI
ncbi:MAG TPA: DUF58 domain-containing protein, partial [Nitrososphaeraceae archaeon]|nr:DUF58 domain-containing protein [Nitrososphaeraceae archaeon]